MIELNDEIRQAVIEQQGEPVELVDSTTKQAYVLVRAEVYERIKGLLCDDFDPDAAAALMNEVMAEDDKDDPYLESYQHYTPRPE